MVKKYRKSREIDSNFNFRDKFRDHAPPKINVYIHVYKLFVNQFFVIASSITKFTKIWSYAVVLASLKWLVSVCKK